MKKPVYFSIALLLIVSTSCRMRNNHVKETQSATSQPSPQKAFFATMQIRDTIRTGAPVELVFTVYNHTDSLVKFLRWQTPFEPLMSQYLEIKDEQGEEVLYKGPMAKRMMPPPASSYLALNPMDSLVAKVDILKGYALTRPAKYTITYTSENVSGLKVRKQVSFVYR
ncbi:protease [Mucilaginibacter sp. UR6-11]|uniref:protease n=1 Tax=Mucilaginibacter sp. UR6-11 TaxID=1435644 RepID=UPI001E51269E|nr:protease [Mucilaginibacter sp. UR6-11]MCC8424654.1 protease [Mucilaginibacter sp. UR6-11]